MTSSVASWWGWGWGMQAAIRMVEDGVLMQASHMQCMVTQDGSIPAAQQYDLWPVIRDVSPSMMHMRLISS
jgi:hypothetical protein